jgi:hypothetical protein
MSQERITEVILLITPLLWIAWDVYAHIKGGNATTESANIWKWTVRLPGIALLVGILIGHLFFEMHEPTQFNTDDYGHVIYQVGPLPLSPGQILTVNRDGLLIPK